MLQKKVIYSVIPYSAFYLFPCNDISWVGHLIIDSPVKHLCLCQSSLSLKLSCTMTNEAQGHVPSALFHIKHDQGSPLFFYPCAWADQRLWQKFKLGPVIHPMVRVDN